MWDVMQIAGITAIAFAGRVAAALPFSPVRLIGLVLWVYFCLYLVQVVRLSPLVPKNHKSIASLVTLLTGPFLLLALLIIDAAKKSSVSGDGVLKTMREHAETTFANLRSASLARRRGDVNVKLLDSSGRSIDQIYGRGDKKQRDSRILDLTAWLIDQALERRASDILIDPKDESAYTVRLRVDGVLGTLRTLNAEISRAVVNSIKAVSSMDIAERRRAQDGSFIAKKGNITASFRVASAGVVNGEKLSIRVLNRDAGILTLADMGLSKKQYSIIRSAIEKPSGMVLMCGPTGSGKTTTMYAMLNEIDRFTRNVITVEDPIEAVLSQTSQIEINPKADITFANTLRNILRQDPDVICVGEIRDEETAEIALRASQTGHLVLATVHCDSNATALIRLLDLGVSPLLLSSGLSLLVSQRLLRRLCKHCKKKAELSPALIQEFKEKRIDYEHMFEAKGCKRCDGTGYYGRMAICDPLVVTNELRADIAENKALISQLRTQGEKKDRTNLRKEGLKRVALGLTSLEELKRVVG
jgi:general secretion pathway protein E